MTNKFSIRRAVPADIHALTDIALRAKAHWGYPDALLDAFRAELTVSDDDLHSTAMRYFVAQTDRERAGFYALEILNAFEVELDALFVEPRMMGRGVGTALMSHAVAETRKLGATSMIIQSDPHASGFYAHIGAELVGRRESSSIPGRYLPEYRIWL